MRQRFGISCKATSVSPLDVATSPMQKLLCLGSLVRDAHRSATRVNEGSFFTKQNRRYPVDGDFLVAKRIVARSSTIYVLCGMPNLLSDGMACHHDGFHSSLVVQGQEPVFSCCKAVLGNCSGYPRSFWLAGDIKVVTLHCLMTVCDCTASAKA